MKNTKAKKQPDAAVYLGLYALAAAVDERLRNRVHLRDNAGRLISSFDQWLCAVERGEWTAENG